MTGRQTRVENCFTKGDLCDHYEFNYRSKKSYFFPNRLPHLLAVHILALNRVQYLGRWPRKLTCLKKDLALARAFKNLDPEEWAKVPSFGMERLMLGVILWSTGNGRNRMIAPPKVVSQRNRSLTSWHQVSLVDLMAWALSAVATEEDMRALVGG